LRKGEGEKKDLSPAPGWLSNHPRKWLEEKNARVTVFPGGKQPGIKSRNAGKKTRPRLF